ncbi:MAG: hypothetical protein BroJett024_37540 [Alphaproteobacteria bacterium]|nr:MAG: hypothetical protein BroJett024_37540 [Alphaproteobacteria bacterium]
MPSAFNVTYWARVPFAEAEVADALRAVSGVVVRVVHTADEAVTAVDTTDFLVLIDAPREQAAALLARVSEGKGRLAAMHFNSAGMEGFSSAGIPATIRVTQVAGALAPAIAEHVMALLLAHARRLPEALASQARCEWRPPALDTLRNLRGTTLLLIGLGHIGRATAALAGAFGMRVLAVNRTVRQEQGNVDVRGLDALDELLPQADAVVACIALMPETHRILDARRIGLCRSGVVIVNVGRGGLIDTDALAAALQSGHVGAAGLDVTDPEPLPPAHRLWLAPNLIVTAHYSGAGAMGAGEIAAQAKASLESWVAERGRARD